MKTTIAMFVAAVVIGVVAGSPADGQTSETSDLLASAGRVALTVELEQDPADQAVVRRRRSNTLALAGGSLIALGVGLSVVKDTETVLNYEYGYYQEELSGSWEDRPYRKLGLATAAAGGGLLWWGLRAVEVPVRFDLAPTRGFRVSRSLGW